MKKLFVSLFAVLAVAASAQTVNIGDLVDYGDLKLEVISLSPAEMAVAKSPDAYDDVVIPGSVTHYDVEYKITKINSFAFLQNAAITSVSFPENLKEIGAQAFMACYNIDSLYFPASLEKIGNSAFYCFNDQPSKLHAVRCDAVMPPTCGDMCFGTRFNAHDGVDRNIPLWVPKGSVQAYRDAYGWEYFNIITDGEESSIVEEIIVPVDPEGIEEVLTSMGIDLSQPMFNEAGQRVDANYRGIILQNGKKYMLR
ncbi:MAG: leucine-rich repeat domain-containing protein [Paludibacteraceae bacterium]|nr:leucine-rich repeat domain-containing protein [Paludibacteraceae bacterium]